MTQLVDKVKHAQSEGVLSSEFDSEAIAQVLFSLVLGFEVQMASNTEMDIDAYAAVCQSIIKAMFSGKGSSKE